MKSLFTFLVCCFVLTTSAQISSTEKEALIDFFHSTQGNGWFTPWDLEKPESTWFGVSIVDNKVVALDLGFNNLQGELPASIGNLENLESLKLFFNQISGSIPDEIGNLKNLKVLDLNSNIISGNIPSTIQNLENIEHLLLSSNNLTGVLPAEIGSLSNLNTLVLFDNHFFGDLPYAISNLTNLEELIIANNNFNFESMQTSLAALSAGGTRIDFDENNSNTDIATLVLDDDN